MRICIDVRCLMEGRRTGVEEYTLGLLGELFELDKKNQYVLFFNSWKEPRFDFDVFKKYTNVKVKRMRMPNKLLNFLFWYLDWPKIDRLVGGADVVFFPNITFGVVGVRAKMVVTFHDLSFERYPEHFSRKRRWWHIFVAPRSISGKAKRIIAVSESTRDDLMSLYGVEKEKISVIHSAIGKKFRVVGRNDPKLVEVKERYDLPYKFILFFGTMEPRKNILGIVRAFNALQDLAKSKKEFGYLSKYGLVLAGERGWKSENIFKEIENSQHRKMIKIISAVPEEDKEGIYNLASLFVYPSFFEGFGFPPLEAAKCGVPVICSNNSSLPEIFENAGVLIDPDKPDEIFRAMREVLSSDKLRGDLIKRGLAQSQKFDWKKTASEFLKAIDKL
jgi:glycosyltransferase involved in cell wall biosynthesis